jgi:hypothetical protein
MKPIKETIIIDESDNSKLYITNEGYGLKNKMHYSIITEAGYQSMIAHESSYDNTNFITIYNMLVLKLRAAKMATLNLSPYEDKPAIS